MPLTMMMHVEFALATERRYALATHLVEAGEDMGSPHTFDRIRLPGSNECLFEVSNGTGRGGSQYLVLNENEADEQAVDAVKGSLWTFKLEFMRKFIPALAEGGEALTEAWAQVVNTRMCESANPLLAALLGPRLDEFIAAAIKSEGRGHFLSPADGKEHRVMVPGVCPRPFYVYRVC